MKYLLLLFLISCNPVSTEDENHFIGDKKNFNYKHHKGVLEHFTNNGWFTEVIVKSKHVGVTLNGRGPKPFHIDSTGRVFIDWGKVGDEYMVVEYFKEER